MLNDVKVGYLSAISSLKRGNKKTSLFIVIILGLIFMNLVFLPALINGMMGFFVGMVQDYSYGDIMIEPSENKVYIENSENILQKVRSVNGVTYATKRLLVGGSVKYKQKVIGSNIIGIVPREEESVSKYAQVVTQGEFLGDISRDEIMVGSILAGFSSASQIYDNLGGVPVGSIVNITYSNGVERSYKIKGIHEGATEMTDLNILIHYKELEDVFGIENKASSVIVRIAKNENELEVKEKIIETGINEKVFTWQEKAEALVKQAIQSMGSIGIMSKIISLIVGASLIFIIIYINTLNRRREIGILKAVGITPNSIRLSYVLISLFYATLGILFGLTMFVTLTLYLQANPIVFYETLTIFPIVDINDLVQSSLVMLGMSIVAGFIPAWFVTRQDILKAIWGR